MENIKTRMSELSFWTSDPEEMQGKYLAENLDTVWNEDYIDQESGAVVTVERHQPLLQKGTLLTPDVMSSLSFHLQAGDVKRVKVTNVCRTGNPIVMPDCTLYGLTVNDSQGKTKCLVRARNLSMALLVATDYFEQKIKGAFNIETAKMFKNCIIVPEDGMARIVTDADGSSEAEQSDGNEVYYNITTRVDSKESSLTYEWFVKATSVEDAKLRIQRYVDASMKQKEDGARDSFWEAATMEVMSGSVSSVKMILPEEMSKAYMKIEDDRKSIENAMKKL